MRGWQDMIGGGGEEPDMPSASGAILDPISVARNLWMSQHMVPNESRVPGAEGRHSR